MGIREDKFIVRTYECQSNGNIKICALMQYLQEIASVHADELGFGNTWLNEINGYWVLSNLRMEISIFPKWNDEVTIRTWPSGNTRLIATREFVGKTQDGRELFRAGSEWMVLDRHTNRPKNLSRLNMSSLSVGPKVIEKEIERLKPTDNYTQIEQISVPYSSIDLNGHVNNTEYVRWGLDALRAKFKFEGVIRSLQVTYLAEVFINDKLDLLVSAGSNRLFYVLGRKSDDANNVFVMEVPY
ncbi:MAG: acyl-[acyl-carrier-protein] thioesterase [Planctomycetota bacterium]|jgi:acyl-ACP thioesterase